MKKHIRQQIQEEALKLHAEGRWEGRKSAVAIAKQLNVTFTVTVVGLAEGAIKKANLTPAETRRAANSRIHPLQQGSADRVGTAA